ncbi:MAG: hypothetical protein ACTSPY_02390 [Candidatus Helarchaeota archaeon]
MEITIEELVKKITHLVPNYSKKFSISEDGAIKFLRLAIIYLARTEYKLETNENILKGDKEKIDELKETILSWDANEFDDEDFEIIGYCQNIR